MDSKPVLVVIIMITLGTSVLLTAQDVYAAHRNYQGGSQSVVVGESEYVAWFSNKSGNWEVLFRTSTDGGQTFSDKINLSNSTETDSVDVELSADGDNVLVTWWERGTTNTTSDEPVGRISTDGGQTFNDMIRLSANGTIGNVEGEG
ncbi:MAG: sialidase family protein [Nitrososphaeraceae archaeon]